MGWKESDWLILLIDFLLCEKLKKIVLIPTLVRNKALFYYCITSHVDCNCA